MSAAVAVSLALPISIPNFIMAGVAVTLPAGTGVIPSGSTTSSPLAAATPVILPDETLVTLTKSTSAWLSDGTPVTLPANAQVLDPHGIAAAAANPGAALRADFHVRQRTIPARWCARPYPVKDLDFSISGAYSIYNWELFFHAPLMIAIHLSQNQQFQDAQNWFHTSSIPPTTATAPPPRVSGRSGPFQYNDVELIQQIMLNLSTGQDPQLQTDTINSHQRLDCRRRSSPLSWPSTGRRPTC